MVKIKVIIPNVGIDEKALERRKKMLSKVTMSSTELSIECIESGPRSIESYYDEALALPSLLNQAKRAEKDGYDTIIIYCGSDPGLEALREILSIPVVGPGRLALLIASELSLTFSVIVPLKEVVPIVKEQIKKVGVDLSRVASIKSVEIPVSEIKPICDIEGPIEESRIFKALLYASESAVKEDGAHAIVLHCLGMAGFGEILQQRLGVPVIDPAFLAVKYAEMLAILKLSHSKRSYVLPENKRRDIML